MSIFGNDFATLFESELKKVEDNGTETMYCLAEDEGKKVLCIESSDGNLYNTKGDLHTLSDTNRYRYMIDNSILIEKSVLE